MVVGNNSPLTNTSSNPSLRKSNRGKLNPEADKGFQEYVTILQALVVESTLPSKAIAGLCECCGTRPPSQVLAASAKEIGRDWFPLAGSLGSDAQALPAGSRSARICGLCLLAIQLLPLGVTLLNGRLACFQSTSWELTQLLTEDTYRETQAMLASSSSNDKVAALGAKGGTTPTAIRLLRFFENLQASRRLLELPPYVTLNVWVFSNFGKPGMLPGTGAGCDLIAIPNSALIFLWETARRFRAEVERMLGRESKESEYQLLERIRRQLDYDQLYPKRASRLQVKSYLSFTKHRYFGIRSKPYALRRRSRACCDNDFSSKLMRSGRHLPNAVEVRRDKHKRSNSYSESRSAIPFVIWSHRNVIASAGYSPTSLKRGR